MKGEKKVPVAQDDQELDQVDGGAINVFDTNEPTKLCPNCKSNIRMSATFCMFCYYVFE